MSWLYYLLEANLYLILFYALYYFVLRRETWYQYNRAYLLVSSALAFIIPVLQLGFLKPIPAAELPAQLTTAYSYVTVAKAAAIVQPAWTRDDILLALYLVIVCCLLISLAIKITGLVLLSRKGPARDFGKWKIIITNMERGAYSFFSYMFVSQDMAATDTVITHELVHIRQKHSWDIVYLEIFRIINWFNPIAYLLQRSMKELHEFIADEAITGSKEQINTYTDFLVANAYGTYEHKLTNNLFNQSLLKKRIMMLHQKRSGNTARLKYLLVLPLLGGLLCASTLAFAKDYGWVDIAPGKALPAGINATDKPASARGPKNKADNDIPMLGSGSIGFIIDPGNYSFKTLTRMSLKFHKKGYTMSFDDYKDNANNPMLKLSLRKNDSKPNSGTSATYRVDELKKMGYAIFVGADPAKNTMHVVSRKFVFVKGDTSQLIRKKTDSIINGRVDSAIKGEIKSQIDQQKRLLPPVVEPVMITDGDTTRQAFYMQVARYTRYPAAARDNKVMGRVFAVFSVDGNNNIVNVGVLRSPDKIMSQEVARVLKISGGKFKGQTGVTYTIPVLFTIYDNQTGKYLDAPVTPYKLDAVIPRDQSVKTNRNIYLDEVVVTTYIKQ